MTITWSAKMSIDAMMDLAERFEKVTAYQVRSFSQTSDGVCTFTFSVFEPIDTEREVSEQELTYTDIDDEGGVFDPSSVCDIVGNCNGCGETTNVNAYHYCEYCWDDLTE